MISASLRDLIEACTPADDRRWPKLRARASLTPSFDDLQTTNTPTTSRDRQVLDFVAEHPGTSIADVAGHLGVDGITARRRLIRLHHNGLILRGVGSTPSRGGHPRATWTVPSS